MFESRISAVRVEKLPFPQNLRISSWSYDVEGHDRKSVEILFELANKTTQQHYKVYTPCIDVHHFQEMKQEPLNNCISALQQQAYAQILALQDAQYGFVESRREHVR